MLGMKQLRRYDIYAPLAKSEKKYSFDESAHLVFDSFRRFDPQLERLARRVFDQGHLDSEVRKGKRGGAFCDTVGPDLTPWVLVNFQGNPDDVATLAHEWDTLSIRCWLNITTFIHSNRAYLWLRRPPPSEKSC